MVIVALRDRVANRFLNVQLERNDKVACRSFVNALSSISRDGTNVLLTNPEDFDLVRIGDFDTITGAVINDLVVLMSGIQAVNFNEVNEDDA